MLIYNVGIGLVLQFRPSGVVRKITFALLAWLEYVHTVFGSKLEIMLRISQMVKNPY